MGIGFLFFGGEYVSFWGDENVLEFEQRLLNLVNTIKATELNSYRRFKIVNFYVKCILLQLKITLKTEGSDGCVN